MRRRPGSLWCLGEHRCKDWEVHLTSTKIRPILRWAGSKRQIVQTLALHWKDTYSRYVEPFAGSACLFFHLEARRALLSDINAELILTYRQVRLNPLGVHRGLTRFGAGRKAYLRAREMSPSDLSDVGRAARFVYLNRYCFNGLYRTNLAGEFNVPYGGTKGGTLPTLWDFRRCSAKLQKARLVAGDFEKALEEVKPGDFVYLDPPFTVRRRRVFNEYDATSFRNDDVLRLRRSMLRLQEIGVPFLVSYAMSDEALYLKEGFKSEVVHVRRSIAGFTRSRKLAAELLIYNKH